MEKKNKIRGFAVKEDVYRDFRREQLIVQMEKENPDLSANDVIKHLLENAKELRELKKGLAENK